MSPAASLPTGSPSQRIAPSWRQHEGLSTGVATRCGAAFDLAGQRLQGGGVQRLLRLAFGLWVGREPETVQPTDMLAFDEHVTRRRDFRFEHRVLSQSTHQHAGAPVHETLRQTLVQGIRQPVLYLTRDALPMLWIGQPVRTVGYEVPGAHLRDARGQRVDVAIGAVERAEMRARTSRPESARARTMKPKSVATRSA